MRTITVSTTSTHLARSLAAPPFSRPTRSDSYSSRTSVFSSQGSCNAVKIDASVAAHALASVLEMSAGIRREAQLGMARVSSS